MTGEIIAGAVAFIVAALCGAMCFAYRAGITHAQVATARKEAERTERTARIVQDMARAEAGKPTTKKELLRRLDGGEA